jgi:hypothetical protein
MEIKVELSLQCIGRGMKIVREEKRLKENGLKFIDSIEFFAGTLKALNQTCFSL